MGVSDYVIRIPLKMIQLTDINGNSWPVAFEWEDSDGARMEIKIDDVICCTPQSELKSGTVGDRYECIIEGRREYLYYTKLAPRKWFKVVPVSEEEYKAYYKLPGELA